HLDAGRVGRGHDRRRVLDAGAGGLTLADDAHPGAVAQVAVVEGRATQVVLARARVLVARRADARHARVATRSGVAVVAGGAVVRRDGVAGAGLPVADGDLADAHRRAAAVDDRGRVEGTGAVLAGPHAVADQAVVEGLAVGVLFSPA